jgi:hypothetical protein
VSRPEPHWEPPEGYELVAVESDSDWVTPAVTEGRCRFGAGPGKKACGKPAVATLMRRVWARSGTEKRPWNYCGEHLYGRWIEDGKVMHWRAQEIKP